MTTSQYISVRETAQILSISEKKVMDLIEERKLQGYRIANKFLRLKRSEVLGLKNAGDVEEDNKPLPYEGNEKIWDFFYFNDFYLLSMVLIAVLLYIIFYV